MIPTWVKCLSPNKLALNEEVACQNPFTLFLSFAFSTALLYKTMIVVPPCNKNCPNM